MAKTLYAIAALFNTPDAVLRAAHATAAQGYTRFDTHTPYPVHGMDRAMRLPRTRLPYLTLLFALSGTAMALLFQWWTLSVDYPFTIGGNPHFAFLAFIPVTFELTVLLGVVLTVAAMLMFFFQFPSLGNPFHHTDYMRCVSSSQFGLAIYAADPRFAEEEASAFLRSLRATQIVPIYREEPEPYRIFAPRFVGGLLATALMVAGGTYMALNYLPYLPPFDFMLDQKKVLPAEKSDLFRDRRSQQRPVEGTVARGFLPYAYSGDPDAASRLLENPLPITREHLQQGEKRFNTFCSPCHGYHGQGDSRLKGQFPMPPSLHSARAIGLSDGHIYHIITEGQNVMPSYAKPISREDRWAVVHYVRALQRALHAKESDLK